MLVPWSAFWDRNYFSVVVPAIDPLLRSGFIRGAVSGLGLVALMAGLADLATLLGPRRR